MTKIVYESPLDIIALLVLQESVKEVTKRVMGGKEIDAKAIQRKVISIARNKAKKNKREIIKYLENKQ